jgi:hypothetical protein
LIRHLREYSYGWITLVLFVTSAAAHALFAWLSGDDLAKYANSVFENWQSEFLQLLWQVCGLAWFLQRGSPSSKEGSERLEAKVDFVMDGFPNGKVTRERINKQFLRTPPLGH